MELVVGQVGEQSLIDIENPPVASAIGNLNGLRKPQRVLRHDLRVVPVPVSGHVVLHKLHAPRRNVRPVTGVICLDGEPPAFAVYIVVYADLAVVGDDFSGGGNQVEEDREEGGHSHGWKSEKVMCWDMISLVSFKDRRVLLFLSLNIQLWIILHAYKTMTGFMTKAGHWAKLIQSKTKITLKWQQQLQLLNHFIEWATSLAQPF